MLKNLFRPKWQHENPQIRKAAIDNLKNSDGDILEQIAINDLDQGVRLHAISKMENLTQLEKVMEQLPGKNEQEFALKCWVSVLTNSRKLNALAVEEFILDCQKEKLLSGIIAYADSNNLRELAMTGIKEESQLLSLMQNTKNGKLWQSIIEKLESEEALKQAQTIVNSRDKKSQQAINKKLDTIKNAKLENQRIIEQATQLSKKLLNLAEADFNPLFEGMLLTYKQQADVLNNSLPESHAAEIFALINRCDERLKKHIQKKTDLALAEQEYVLENATHDQLLEKLTDLRKWLLGNLTINQQDITQSKSDISDIWLNIKNSVTTKKEQIFNREMNEINLILDAHKIAESIVANNNHVELLSRLNFSDTQNQIVNLEKITGLLNKANADKAAPFFHHINMLLDAAKKHKNNLVKKATSLQQDAKKLLIETENYIEKKDLKNAQIAFSRIRKILGELPEEDSKIYNTTTQRLFNAIKTLEDWRDYAGDEKRNELCLQMKALIPLNNDLLAKADAIHDLQQRWKNLGHCHNQELWKEFKNYADEAYLPCQTYFNEQKKIRQFNAEQRTTICEQLEILTQQQNWSNTDWKALDGLLKTIHDEWEKYLPVDKEYNKKLNDRFFSSIKFIKAKINNERKNNTEKLCTLVEQANKLIESENIQESIESYTHLQQIWKTVGITYHNKQHELWLNFKAAGDLLYKKRQNARNEIDNERHENLKKAQKICQDIIELSQPDGTDTNNSKAIFDNLTSSFKGLGALPKEKLNDCQRTFENACNIYHKNIRELSRRDYKKQLDNLAQIANEWLILEEQHEKPDITINHRQIPEKWLKRIYSRFDNNLPENPFEQAKILCIEMEILADINTPEEDSAIKMRWQMTNLAKNFGLKQEHSEMEKIEDLYIRWYSQKCWNRDEYKQLENRFLNAANKLFTA